MPSEKFKCVGPGEVLAFLRADLRRARQSLLIIGPWLDDYFAEQIVAAASHDLAVRVLVRPDTEVDALAWERTLAALSIFAGYWSKCEARQLARLHAKCLCIDEGVIYVGSANWYRHSLEDAVEVVLRGPIVAVEGGMSQLEGLWERGQVLQVRAGGSRDTEGETPAEGITHEVLDPLAARALQENPKAFVIGKKPCRKNR